MKQAGLFGDQIELDVVLDYIREHPDCSIHDIAQDVRLSTTEINLSMMGLNAQRDIEPTGWCRRGPHNQPSIMWRAING